LSTPSSVGELGEHGLIALIRDRLPAAPAWVAIGLGDDAAVVLPARNTFDVLTTDAELRAAASALAEVVDGAPDRQGAVRVM